METICKHIHATNHYSEILSPDQIDKESFVYFLPEKEYKVIHDIQEYIGRYWYFIEDEYKAEHCLYKEEYDKIFYSVREIRNKKLKKLKSNEY